jgi:hypothetical protein
MNTTNENGRVQRKTLASQLDRLDNTIDALADGVNKAVADAVREAVTLAVQQAIELVVREVLARPELLRQLTGQTIPAAVPAATEPVPAKPAKPAMLMSVLSWIGSKFRGIFKWAGRKSCGVPSRIRSVCQWAREKGQSVWAFRGAVAVSLLIGLAVGMAGYLAGPFLSSVALGACSSAMSLSTFLAAPFVRLWRRMKTQLTLAE